MGLRRELKVLSIWWSAMRISASESSRLGWGDDEDGPTCCSRPVAPARAAVECQSHGGAGAGAGADAGAGVGVEELASRSSSRRTPAPSAHVAASARRCTCEQSCRTSADRRDSSAAIASSTSANIAPSAIDEFISPLCTETQFTLTVSTSTSTCVSFSGREE